MKKYFYVFGIGILLILMGCIERQEIDYTNNSTLVNPASKFCVDNGGKLDIRTETDGSQIGYCIFREKECEEWEFYRGECSQAHICTNEEKQNEICTMEYIPVCGDDGIIYGNKCAACSAKIISWIIGEC
ncbi:DUF333 domain-containing protein [Candidatus Micrarchaeota archaeon]|nr:DUF333 domain-containing protein [Candidatus Micrarchaeota archaeon]